MRPPAPFEAQLLTMPHPEVQPEPPSNRGHAKGENAVSGGF